MPRYHNAQRVHSSAYGRNMRSRMSWVLCRPASAKLENSVILGPRTAIPLHGKVLRSGLIVKLREKPSRNTAHAERIVPLEKIRRRDSRLRVHSGDRKSV